MSDNKKAPTHYAIFNYWKEEKLSNGQPVIVDWGEPSCWACDKPVSIGSKKQLTECNYSAIWNSVGSRLEKCHIIPKALGGSYEPKNMFLLCSKCHDDSPDTNKRAIFINWVELKRSRSSFGIDIHEEMSVWEDASKIMGVDINDVFNAMREKIKPMTPANISEFVKKSGIKTNSHGFDYSSLSFKTALIKALKINKEEVN